MGELGKLPATLFSPAKMVYIAYVLMLWHSSTTCQHRAFSLTEFLCVSFAFFLVEIIHNDWGRIRLNNCGEENRPEWLRPLIMGKDGKWLVAQDKDGNWQQFTPTKP